AQVARERQHGTAADAEAVDRGDRDLVERVDRGDGAVADARALTPLEVALRLAFLAQVAQIRARRERAPRARQDDDARREVLAQLGADALDLTVLARRQRVQL